MNNELFAKVPEDRPQDRRAHAAAHHLARSAGIPEEWAYHAVIGVLASIDLWLLAQGRAGETGELPDDGFALVRSSCGLPPAAARAALSALVHGAYLVRRSSVTVRVGFEDEYSDRLGNRRKLREWHRQRREARGAEHPPPGEPSANGSRTVREPLADGPPPVSKTGRRAVAFDSAPPSERTAVDVPSPSTTGGPTSTSTAPGGRGGGAARPVAKSCGRCKDGLVLGHGRRPRCCDCPRGRERARAVKKSVLAETTQAAKAAAAKGRTGRSGSIRDDVAGLAATIGIPLPAGNSGDGGRAP